MNAPVVAPYPGDDDTTSVPAEIPAWGLSDVVAHCAGVREATVGATTMEDAAAHIVRYLRRVFRTSQGRPAFALARLFTTAPWEDLAADLREIVHPAGSPDPAPVEMRSLVLLASDGELPEWCDRSLSVGHRAIPLASEEILGDMPMISALVREMGIGARTLVHGHSDEAAATYERTDFGVFHVEDTLRSDLVPAREFVVAHGIRSVVGCGGILPTGNVFSVVLFSHVTIDAAAAEMLRAVGVSVRLALLPYVTEPMFRGGRRRPADHLESALARVASLEQMLDVHESTVADQAGRLEDSLQLLHRHESRLRREAGIIDTLHRVGTVLGADLDIGRVTQEATDAVVDVTGAEFGAFFHDQVGSTGESYVLYTLSGAPREAFERFPLPRRTAIFAPTFTGSEIVRSADITTDPRYGHSTPYHGMPPGHLPVRSYLAVPVISVTGSVHGGIFLGHPEVGVFDERAERLAVGIAAQAAAALDNALLYTGQRRVARALQANLLTPPASTGRTEVCARYVPAMQHAEVGGDWYDSFVLPSGDTTVVVGDVVGHDLHAAACMAQLRNVVRSIAVDRGDTPAEIVRHTDEVSAQLGITNFATMVFGRVEEAVDGNLRLRWTNAGHPPPLLLHPDGHARLLRHAPNLPLGIRPGDPRQDHVEALPVGSTLLLYTDGLVEGRHRLVSVGLERLVQAAEELGELPLDKFCDSIIDRMAGPDTSDDIALIALRVPRR
ncbi:MAG TPA: GAF domain-containing SpoIIE family protein phosphatase [Mycobacteriales bacterium]|jgi:serine phosphatase RsbU (regulator of sigma subunit)|nr:GAF domain-containing SpoIIE family protein phosphatase [Mycobacteriales bacterium]